MMNSNRLSNKVSVSKVLIFLGLFISLVGFADASYLTIKHFQGVLPNCTIVHGCERVLTSEYSKLLGMPVALFGAVYYLAIFIGLAAYLDSKNETLLRITSLATSAGLIASLYFFHLQLIIIKAWCQFCIISIITSTLLFILGIAIFRSVRTKDNVELYQG